MRWKSRIAIYATLAFLVVPSGFWLHRFTARNQHWDGLAQRRGRIQRSTVFPILLIHGMGGDGRSWLGLSGYLERKGLRFGGVLRIRSRQVGVAEGAIPIEQADFFRVEISDPFDSLTLWSHEIAQFVAMVRERTGSPRVVLVGHSAGGLAARRYLVAHFQDHGVAKLLTVASPHRGTPLASFDLMRPQGDYGSAEEFAQAVWKWLGDQIRVPPGAPILAGLRPEDRNEGLLDLNRMRHPQDVEYECILALGRPGALPNFFMLGPEILTDPLVLLKSFMIPQNDGVVPVMSQDLRNVFFFQSRPDLVRKCPGLRVNHTEIREQYGVISAGIGSHWRILRTYRKPDLLSGGEMLEIEFQDFFAGVVRIKALDARSNAALPVSRPALYQSEDGVIGHVVIGPIDPVRTTAVELEFSSPGAQEPLIEQLKLQSVPREPASASPFSTRTGSSSPGDR